ncbi:hypothetical protein NCCP691_38880 [Noviherbaspirillum aridicola]|uniref:Uncharacterized protein n=1 Tax=Noviherbaspirillum aridicola TaxID=2849687 RepID=A0ABQ4Q9Z4_9BURK|nr:hypothetical protein NCCP691_38880 [Noviherbaspirillum aridicola]
MQRVHGHAVFGAAVGEQELVEFLEFLVGEGVVEMHGEVGLKVEDRYCKPQDLRVRTEKKARLERASMRRH